MFEDTSNYGYNDYGQAPPPQQSPQNPPNPNSQNQQIPFSGNQQMFGNEQFQQMGMAMGTQLINQHTAMISSKAQEYIPTTK